MPRNGPRAATRREASNDSSVRGDWLLAHERGIHVTLGHDAFSHWLADYYAVATFVFLGTGLIMVVLRQPARRLAVAWTALGGLVALSVLGAIPFWPRTSLIAWPALVRQPGPRFDKTTPRDAVASVPSGLAGRARSQTEALAGSGSPADVAPASMMANEPVPLFETPGADATVRSASESRPVAQAPLRPLPVDRLFLAGVVLILGWLAAGTGRRPYCDAALVRAPEWSRAVLARVVGAGRAAPELRVSAVLRQPVADGRVAAGNRAPRAVPKRRAREPARGRAGPRMGPYPQPRHLADCAGAFALAGPLRYTPRTGGCAGGSATTRSCWPTLRQPRWRGG